MNKMMFITDSLGAPRNEYEKIKIEHTWCNIVAKKKKYECFYHSNNGFDSQMLSSKIENTFNLYSPNVIILQVGIVDCAPRVLKRKEVQILKNLGCLSKVTNIIISRNYQKFSKMRDISYTDTNSFELNLIKFRDEIEAQNVFAIAIAKPSKKYISKSPLITERYEKYNKNLYNVFGNRLIDPYQELEPDKLESLYIEDGYHLNKFGHEFLAKFVLEKLEQFNI